MPGCGAGASNLSTGSTALVIAALHGVESMLAPHVNPFFVPIINIDHEAG